MGFQNDSEDVAKSDNPPLRLDDFFKTRLPFPQTKRGESTSRKTAQSYNGRARRKAAMSVLCTGGLSGAEDKWKRSQMIDG